MKPNESMLAILELCEKIDSKASAIYHHLAVNEKDPAMKDFWNDMSEDEKMHILSWKLLSELILKGDIQQMFDNPQDIKEELKLVLSKKDDNKMPFLVTASIGVAYKVLEGGIEKEVDELIKEADDNLYKAKESGKNRVIGKLI